MKMKVFVVAFALIGAVASLPNDYGGGGGGYGGQGGGGFG